MDPDKEYTTISKLMSKLAEFMEIYGDIPILVSSDETEGSFLRPLEEAVVFQLAEKESDENQYCVVLTNYEIEDKEDK